MFLTLTLGPQAFFLSPLRPVPLPPSSLLPATLSSSRRSCLLQIRLARGPPGRGRLPSSAAHARSVAALHPRRRRPPLDLTGAMPEPAAAGTAGRSRDLEQPRRRRRRAVARSCGDGGTAVRGGRRQARGWAQRARQGFFYLINRDGQQTV